MRNLDSAAPRPKSLEDIHPPKSFQDCSFFTIRHGDAQYQMNEGIVASETPESVFNPKEQGFDSDLTPEGQRLAAQKAQEFFSQFDPNKDVLYFASSNLIRARETATIFLDTAKKMRFEIIESAKPYSEKVSPDILENLGGNDIRTLESLSLNLQNMLVEFIFHPHNYVNPREGESIHIHYPENISPATLELWERGRKIIEADNKGTWGKNFLAHSAEIQKLFARYSEEHPDANVPRITTAEDMYVTRFKAMLREMKAAKEKVRAYEKQNGKRVRVLAFSHENAFLTFLDTEFNQQGIDKLEAVGYEIEKDKEGNEHYFAAIENSAQGSSVKEIALPTRSATITM